MSNAFGDSHGISTFYTLTVKYIFTEKLFL